MAMVHNIHSNPIRGIDHINFHIYVLFKARVVVLYQTIKCEAQAERFIFDKARLYKCFKWFKKRPMFMSLLAK